VPLEHPQVALRITFFRPDSTVGSGMSPLALQAAFTGSAYLARGLGE